MKSLLYWLVLVLPLGAYCFPLEHEESESFRKQIEDPYQIQPASTNYSTEHFYQLPLSENDCHNIKKLIKNLADLSIWSLLGKISEMNKLGDKVNHIHPKRFIGYIYSTPSLKKRMPKIRDSSFKWGKFVDGFGKRMAREHRNENLFPHVPGFCQHLGVNPTVVNRFIETNDWEGILIFLMD